MHNLYMVSLNVKGIKEIKSESADRAKAILSPDDCSFDRYFSEFHFLGRARR